MQEEIVEQKLHFKSFKVRRYKMKKKVFSKKLSLEKVTIAALNAQEMNSVLAGEFSEVRETCRTYGCTCPTKDNLVETLDCF